MFGKGGSHVKLKRCFFSRFACVQEDIVEMMKETRVYSELRENKVNLERLRKF